MVTPLLNRVDTTRLSSGASTICAGHARFPKTLLNQTPFIGVPAPAVFDGFFQTGYPVEISPSFRLSKAGKI